MFMMFYFSDVVLTPKLRVPELVEGQDINAVKPAIVELIRYAAVILADRENVPPKLQQLFYLQSLNLVRSCPSSSVSSKYCLLSTKVYKYR